MDVIIVDKRIIRRDKLAKVFVQAGANVYLLLESGAPRRCQLAIVHDTDKENWDEARISCEHVVYYTGGTEFSDHYIQRAITPKSGLLSLEEARALLVWAALPPSKHRAKPKLLLKTKPIEHLATLSILCQGYLAICDSSQESVRAQCEIVKQANWWRAVFNGDSSSIIAELGSNPCPSSLELLLKALFEQHTVTEITPTIVKPASEALTATLSSLIEQRL
jgi:hypothetical protein